MTTTPLAPTAPGPGGTPLPGPHPWRATLQGDTAWQVTAVIPDLGHAIELLRTPAISHTLVHGASVLPAVRLLLPLSAPTRPRDGREHPPPAPTAPVPGPSLEVIPC